jgi:hypothetical protein
MIDRSDRDRLRRFADVLIPAAHGMPSAREVGVADGQLDRVLAVRDDLTEPLLRAIARVDADAHDDSLAALARDDAEAHDALLLVIVGGYYIDPEVRRRLGYDGQVPAEVRPEIIPNYVEEGLIEPLLERGPVYRQVPGSGPTVGSAPAAEPREPGIEFSTARHGTGRP